MKGRIVAKIENNSPFLQKFFRKSARGTRDAGAEMRKNKRIAKRQKTTCDRGKGTNARKSRKSRKKISFLKKILTIPPERVIL